MLATIYNDNEAELVADNFFKNYYHDRGKVKWEGFFLSEHTAALHKNKEYIDGTKRNHRMPKCS